MRNLMAKKRLREVWNRFWADGKTNSLEALEQIAYIVLLKKLGAGKTPLSISENSFMTEFDWSNFIELSPDEMYKKYEYEVFPWLRSYLSRYDVDYIMEGAVVSIPRPYLLAELVSLIDALGYECNSPGDIFETLLAEFTITGNKRSQRTPSELVQTMVELVDPQKGERICDPVAGTASFLSNAYHWIKKQGAKDQDWSRNEFVAYDFDKTVARIGFLSMIINEVPNMKFYCKNSLTERYVSQQNFDLVLGNLPIGMVFDRFQIPESELNELTTKGEILFIELCIRLLRKGGRAAVIVPDTLLSGKTRSHFYIRQTLLDSNCLKAIISLPADTFKPFSGVKTSIIYFEKGGSTSEIWYYDTNIDEGKTDELIYTNTNQLLFVPQAYRKIVQNEPGYWVPAESEYYAHKRCWVVSAEQIKEANYELAAAAYRPLTESEIEYQDPYLLLKEIRNLENHISEKLNNVERILKKRGAEL